MREPTRLAFEFSQRLAALRASITDAEGAFGSGALRQSTRDDVVELSLVRALGLFEEYLGDLFAIAIRGRIGKQIQPLLMVNSPEEATLVLTGMDGDDRYVSWFPYKEKTLARAKRYIEFGLPFDRLTGRSAELAALREMTTVRNAVAHDSGVARNALTLLASAKGYPSSRAADY